MKVRGISQLQTSFVWFIFSLAFQIRVNCLDYFLILADITQVLFLKVIKLSCLLKKYPSFNKIMLTIGYIKLN